MDLFKCKKDGMFDTEAVLRDIDAASARDIISDYVKNGTTRKSPLHQALRFRAIQLQHQNTDLYLGESITTDIIPPRHDDYPQFENNQGAIEHAETIIRAMAAILSYRQLAAFKNDDFIQTLLNERRQAAALSGSTAATDPQQLAISRLLE